METELKKDQSVNTDVESAKDSFVHGPKYINWIYKLDNLGIETRGIERVSPEEREELSQVIPKWKLFVETIGLWWAACGGLTSMSSFFLPTLLFGLNLRDSMVPGLIAMIIGCLVPAYTSTMGPKSGCRQMVSARFLFGQWGVKFVSLVTIVGGIGWSVVNSLMGGQMLRAINHNVSLDVGIVVICVITLIVAIFGIRVVLKFQTILSIPLFVACILFYVVVCQKMDYIHDSNELVKEAGYSAVTTRGNWLSYFAICYSVTATWGAGASDYYILYPEKTPSYQIFLITFLGIGIPSTFVAIAGTFCGTIALSYKPWNDAYNEFGVGGLIVETFSHWGRFGKFVSVLLYLSLICNNIMNTYSCAFEFQLIDRYLLYVPRWIWATVITVIYFVLSIAGKNHFSTILGNFLPMLGYWITIYIALLLEENLIFRSTVTTRKLHEREFDDADDEEDYDKLYNWDNWNDPKKITMGLAASLAFGCGVAGAVIGMNQTYYQGPIAKLVGDYGADLTLN
ncbi:putative pyridoxine transport protein [Candida maltosa Xu316]|uniref:Putative pyridoxine transport protein n=1 Tax=Candida maltosa (strain Xu316) TaxID=1245528 RepID=M3K3H4_CANMX|nr:putative pyridoxine transport protein [Candida maltosa Xu316]